MYINALNIVHLVSHAGKKATLDQTERNVVKRTPHLGASVTLGGSLGYLIIDIIIIW